MAEAGLESYINHLGHLAKQTQADLVIGNAISYPLTEANPRPPCPGPVTARIPSPSDLLRPR
jgi:hypothetical protein